MIKYLSTAAIVATLLTGCGGSDNDKKSSSSASSTPVSSAPASSAPASSAPASSAPASSMPASSASSSVESADLSFSFAGGIEGWYLNGSGANILLEHDEAASALRMQPVSWPEPEGENWRREARTNLSGPTDFTGATVTAVISVPQSYVTEGELVIQIVLQGAVNGVYSYNPVSELVAGDNTIVMNVAPENPAHAMGITTVGVMLGTPPGDLTLLDPILIKSIEIDFPDASSSSSSEASSSSSAANGMAIPMTSTWRDHAGGVMSYTADGVVMTTTAMDQGIVADVPGPINMVGATVTFVINVSAEYKASGAALQPFVQEKASWVGYWDCWEDSETLTAGADQTITCGPLLNVPALNVTTEAGVQIGFIAKNLPPAGTVTVKSAVITLAP